MVVTPPCISAWRRRRAVSRSSSALAAFVAATVEAMPPPALGDFLISGAGTAHGMFVGAGAAEDQVGVAIDQPGRDPGAAAGRDFLCPEPGQLGALADPDDLAVGDADCGIGEQAQRIARRRDHRRDMAVGQKAVPHDRCHWAAAMLVVKHEQQLAQPFRTDCRQECRCASGHGRRPARCRVGHPGAMRPGAGPAACDLAADRALRRRDGARACNQDRRSWRRADRRTSASKRRPRRSSPPARPASSGMR